jgi:surfeit locus 1 family protein
MENESPGGAVGKMTSPRIWPIVLWSGLGIAILCALGTWQIFRLDEKEALLAAIQARSTAAPISLVEALRQHEQGEDVEFRLVKTSGTFDQAHEVHKLTTFDGAPGWEIITPFLSVEGVVALVDRGVVPDSLRDPAKRSEAAAPSEITAIVRTHQSGQGYFDPENDEAKNQWHWWDVPAMLAAVAIPANVKVAPFVLQALPAAGSAKFPRAAMPQTNISNNHLQYALTWFSLAAVLLVIAGLFVAKQVRRTGA